MPTVGPSVEPSARRTVRPAAVPAAALVAAAAAVCVSCGVPAGGPVRTVDPETVPYALLSPAPTVAATNTVSPSPPTPAAESTPGTVATANLFLIDDDFLVAVPTALGQQAGGGGPQADVRTMLARLAAGPGKDQRDAGLASALGPDVTLRLVDVSDGTARVDVSLPTGDPSADRLPLAVGQIVLTVTSVAGVDAVVLVQGGAAIEIPLPGGARTSEPVGATDYQDLLAPLGGALTPGPVPATETPPPPPPAPG